MAFQGRGKPNPPITGVGRGLENKLEADVKPLHLDPSVRHEDVFLLLGSLGDIVARPNLMAILGVLCFQILKVGEIVVAWFGRTKNLGVSRGKGGHHRCLPGVSTVWTEWIS